MNSKRFFTWGAFIIIIGLIVWGLIAASNKTARESAGIPLPDQITSSDWVKTSPGVSSSGPSLVTLVEYADFQCPACGAYFPLLERLFASSTNLRMVYRHFPLPQHQNAIPAARAAEAAGTQGKFWEMHDMLFTTQKDWENSTDAQTVFAGYAKNLGLNVAQFAADVESKDVQDRIDADVASGEKAGINATPTFYVNGKKIVNPQTYDDFKKIIDDAAQAHS